MFDTYPDIFEELKTGTLLEIQASMYLQVDSLPSEWIYSNIDTVYLPPATSDDIVGFYYLKSKSTNFTNISIFDHSNKLSLLEWEYVRDNFKNSIISEYAEERVLSLEYTKRSVQGNPYSLEEFKQLRLVLWKKLRNSKSEITADWAKMQLWDSGITD